MTTDSLCSIAFGFVYWYVWLKLIPRWRGYRVEEKASVLNDGTTITQLIHVAI